MKNIVELDMLVKFTVIHLHSVGIKFSLAVYFRFFFKQILQVVDQQNFNFILNNCVAHGS